ncbi:hypothetical protein L226DRAFT_562760 [Lentinus tigrinus ALCF2SS1-7]|uniref:uncharacterized protein n=1 Tax=Lentinus tigrinus ALCF2SS1-7 TaxID=1328758 RepID=UPI001166054C|nr:hypothetical protein L226DRAFT_562760 [Lentinus tigrinus ALCF2SS1-7]
MYALALASAALLAGQAAATAVPRNALTGLLVRQTTSFDPSDIPAQCQPDCSVIISALNSCSAVSCLCTDSTNMGLFTCLQCSLGLDPDPALLAQGQDSLSEYQEACKEAGVSITPFSLSIPSGASATGTSDSSATSHVSVTFDSGLPTGFTATGSGSTPTGSSGSTQTTAGGVSNPFATDGAASHKNGAGFLAVSSTAVFGVVCVAMAVLSL